MKTFLFSIALFILLFPLTGNSQSIQTTIIGKGKPVLLLPGFASTHHVWDNTVEQLQDYKELHLVDYAGCGVVAPVKQDWLATVKIELLEYIHSLDTGELTIKGHSMGGTLGVWLASQSPNIVHKLIIIDGLPATGALMFPNMDLSTLSYDSDYNKNMLDMDADAFAQTVNYMSTGMATAPVDQAKIKEAILKTDRITYVHGYTDYLKLDVRKELIHLKIPVIILGAGSPYGVEMAAKTFDDQYANLKEYQLFIAPTAKHFIMYDAPEWLAQHLKNALL